MKADWTARTRRILVVGPSQSGKSSWAEVCLRGWPGRVWAFDHKGEFAARCKLPVVSHLSDLEQGLLGRCAFNPHVDFEGQTGRAFNLFSAVAWEASKRLEGEKLFVVDELQAFIGPSRYELPQALANLLESGRGYRASVLCIAQGGNLVNARLRQQFTECVAFRQSEVRAVSMLETLGFQRERLSVLSRLQFIHRNIETGGEVLGQLGFLRGRAVVFSVKA